MIVWIYHGILHVTTGKENTSVPYGLWSGVIPCLAMFAGLGTFWRHVNCHVDGCKRLVFHHVSGTQFKVCRRHHPTGGNTVEHIHDAHRRATAA